MAVDTKAAWVAPAGTVLVVYMDVLLVAATEAVLMVSIEAVLAAAGEAILAMSMEARSEKVMVESNILEDPVSMTMAGLVFL